MISKATEKVIREHFETMPIAPAIPSLYERKEGAINTQNEWATIYGSNWRNMKLFDLMFGIKENK